MFAACSCSLQIVRMLEGVDRKQRATFYYKDYGISTTIAPKLCSAALYFCDVQFVLVVHRA
jgi:hypothetical protein